MDPATIDYGEGDDDGETEVALDLAALRFMNGEPLTEEGASHGQG